MCGDGLLALHPMVMSLPEVLGILHDMADPEKVKTKQVKFGITANHSLGVYQKDLNTLAKTIGRDKNNNNDLAVALFDSGIYEARLLCSKIYDPAALTEQLMEEWVVTFESWEICDSFCMGFFAKSAHARTKAFQWSEDAAEFVKRAGFALMAGYSFADKQAGNEIFQQFLHVIEREATDERLYVKKAVNWALRNIGKRNIDLRTSALATANRILQLESTSAQWIARDALRELQKPSTKILDYPRAVYRQ